MPLPGTHCKHSRQTEIEGGVEDISGAVTITIHYHLKQAMTILIELKVITGSTSAESPMVIFTRLCNDEITTVTYNSAAF